MAYKARKSGVKSGERVSPFARQQNLFAFDDGATVSDYTNATIMMLADIVNGAKVTELKKTISIYNDRARDAASGQSDIFSAELKTKEDILKEVNELLNYGTEEAKESALSRADASRRASSESVGAESVEQDGTAGVSREGSADVEDSVQAALTAAEQVTNTEPTEAQKEAGNYKKGHVKIDGYNITIENPKGSERSGQDKDGKKWSITMNNTYGYILGTEGVDGDHIDVFLSDNPSEGNVYVVDQVNADGSFDEHKVMYGFPDIESARKAYLSNYEEGWQGLGNITGVSKEEFKKWVDSSHRKTKPFAEYSNVKPLGEGQSKETRETALRDGLIDKLRSAGIEVITDEEEAQRVLDADRERRARLMGSRVEKRKQEIAAKLEGKEMSDEQRTVVNVFTGRNNNLTLNITDKSGKSRSIVMRQGNELNAGTKHSIYRHYGTSSNGYTAEEIMLIPDIIRNGERHQDSSKGISYSYEKEGTKYTVTTEIRGKGEQFTNFYTNRKPTAAEQGTQNTDEQRVQPQQSVSAAKLQKVSDFANYSPVYYSNAEKAVEGISQNKATAEQWLAMIQKQGGLKAGEDKWLGLRDWLTARKGQSLTKEELLDYIRENQVHVDEVSYTANPQGFEDLKREYDGWLRNGGYDYAWEQLRERFGDDADIAFTDFGGELEIDNPEAASALLGSEMAINSIRLDYTTEGLDNKREIALTVPDIDSWNENDEVHFGDAGQGRAVAWVRFGETTDSDGNRVLVIDEIQSKRHQEGRERGYITDEDKTARRLHDEYVKAREMVNDYETVLERKYNVSHISDEMLTEEEAEHRRGLWKAVQDARDADRAYNYAHPGNRLAGGIPDAPFEKNWHELAMKRMLRYAAENGFDKVAWTMGEQQAERYNIGGKIERIVKTDDHVYEVYLNNKPMMDLEFDEDGIYRDEGDPALDGKSISDVFGKSLAERLDALPVGERLQEDGLRMGGEGMKGFYDEILPRFMDKYGKKWGIKTVDVTLPYVEESGRTMHSVDVTPEMRESVMEGQPMFLRTDSGEVYGFTKDGKIYIDPRKATAETPVHEFTHLWADGLRKANPKAWEQLKNELEKEKDLFDYVKSLYPELSGDDLMDEVFAHFSGRRGAERLRSEQEKMMQKANGIFDKAKITTMFDRLRNILHDFWAQARDLFAGKTEGIEKLSAEDFADMALADLIKGEKPLAEGKKEARYNKAAGLDVRTYDNSNHQTRDEERVTLGELVSGDRQLRERFGDEEGYNTGEEATDFHTVIDEIFDNADFDKSVHQRERYDLGKTPTWMKRIGIAGDRFSLSFKNIKTHKGKDADHDLTREEWHQLPDALKNPFAVTRYNDANDRFRLYVNVMHNGNYVAVGVDVKCVNQGRNLPMMEVNTIKTVFAHHGEIGGGEKLITYDKEITPKQEALLRGLNFREYPTIQELSAAKITNNSQMRSIESKKVDEKNYLYREQDESEDVYDAGRRSLEETLTQGLIDLSEKNRSDVGLRISAMKAISSNLSELRSAMSRQRDYDKSTVNRIVRWARMLMESGIGGNLTRYEVKRLTGMIAQAAGKEDITRQAGQVMDLLINNQLRASKDLLQKQMRIKGSKIDSRGVEVQGALDIRGQRMIGAFKEGISLGEDAFYGLPVCRNIKRPFGNFRFATIAKSIPNSRMTQQRYYKILRTYVLHQDFRFVIVAFSVCCFYHVDAFWQVYHSSSADGMLLNDCSGNVVNVDDCLRRAVDHAFPVYVSCAEMLFVSRFFYCICFIFKCRDGEYRWLIAVEGFSNYAEYYYSITVWQCALLEVVGIDVLHCHLVAVIVFYQYIGIWSAVYKSSVCMHLDIYERQWVSYIIVEIVFYYR